MSRVAIPDYLDRRAEAPALEEAALFTTRRREPVDRRSTGAPRRHWRSPRHFFTTLGRGPLLGRAFVDPTRSPDRSSHGPDLRTWRSRFGSDPPIVGRPIHLNGGEYLVVGVLPSDFEVPWPAWRDTALLVPFSFSQRGAIGPGTG